MQTSRKRFTNYQHQKLTEFAYKPAFSEQQDGAGPDGQRNSYTDLPDEIPEHHQDTGTQAETPCSPGDDPLPGSPAKAKMRLDAPPMRPQRQLIEAQAPNPLTMHQALHSSMASFPTSGQPIIDTTLKDMLISLQSSLMTDLSSMFQKITSDLHSLDDRVHNTERGLTECTTTINAVIDSYEAVKEEQVWVRAKLADLEDRSRRNNVKLRGIPESILPADLPRYAKELMHTIIPEASLRDIIIDRIHRIAKPSHLAASVPRDVLMRVHFYHIKEKLLMGVKAKSPLPAPYTGIQFFPDLSKFTLQLRRQMNPITKSLQNHKVPYKWRYPATIIIVRNGQSHSIVNLDRGLKLLQSWGIIPEPPPTAPPSRGPKSPQGDTNRNYT